jgi:hypothetical protein
MVFGFLGSQEIDDIIRHGCRVTGRIAIFMPFWPPEFLSSRFFLLLFVDGGGYDNISNRVCVKCEP